MKSHKAPQKNGSVMTYEEMYQQYIKERNRNVVKAIDTSNNYKQFKQFKQLETNKALYIGNEMLADEQQADGLQYE